MVETAKHTKRVVQVGIHRRSASYCKQAAEFVRSGAIGQVTVARAARVVNEYPHGIGRTADADPPPGVDWDLFLGPAPAVPYNENRMSYKFRWFYDYSGGQLTDNGVHFLDLIQWGLGRDAPLAVTAVGGKYAVRDSRQTVDTMEALWEFPGGTLVTFSDFGCNAAAVSATKPFLAEWRGTKGTVYVYGTGWEVIPEYQGSMPDPGGSPPAGKPGAARRASALLPARDGSQAGSGPRRHTLPRPQFPRLRQEPGNAELRCRNRSPGHHDCQRGQHRIQDSPAPELGPRERTIHQQCRGEQLPPLRIPKSVETRSNPNQIAFRDGPLRLIAQPSQLVRTDGDGQSVNRRSAVAIGITRGLRGPAQA